MSDPVWNLDLDPRIQNASPVPDQDPSNDSGSDWKMLVQFGVKNS